MKKNNNTGNENKKMKKCYHCDKLIPDDAIFCLYCGCRCRDEDDDEDEDRNRRNAMMGSVYAPPEYFGF